MGDGDQYRNRLVLNFENGTIYSNAGPLRSDPVAEQPELSLVVRKDGCRHLSEQAIVAPSGEYRWDVFHRAIRGEHIHGLLPPEVAVNGLRIVRAMSEADLAGECVQVR